MTTGAPLAAFAEINAARSARRQIPRRLEVAGSDVNLRPQFAEMSRPARAYGPPTGGEAVNGPLGRPGADRIVDILGRYRIR